MKKIYDFIGSVRCAIFLIASTALFVIAGTILESISESHLYAAQFTYKSPLFYLLLGGFFLNILISALRRWPFKAGHLPFLITHLGLLMIITGTFIKSIWGTQGNLTVLEGSVSHEIFLSHTQALKIENRRRETIYLPVKGESTVGDLSIKVLNRTSHSRPALELWVKGDQLHLSSYPPFPLVEEAAQISPSVKLKEWTLYAVRSADVAATAKKIYLQNMTMQISESSTGKKISSAPLPAENLDFSFSPVLGFETPKILWDGIEIPLQGAESLLNLNLKTPYLGPAAVAVDLEQIPSLVFIQDFHGDDYLFAFDAQGRVHCEPFRADNLNSLYLVDEGFAGYAVQSTLELSPSSHNRPQLEQIRLDQLASRFRSALLTAPKLSPPLQLLFEATQRAGVDFVDTTIRFLSDWNFGQSWLYPLEREIPSPLKTTLANLDWKSLPEATQRSCALASLLLREIDPELKAGKKVSAILQEKKWPLAHQLVQVEADDEILYALHQQLDAIGDQIPLEVPNNPTLQEKAHLLSAYLRTYGIHLHHLLQSPEIAEREADQFTLETSITQCLVPLAPERKLEENIPTVSLEFSQKNGASETITLAYDRYGTGIKWPVLVGSYLVRFQPLFQKIPYAIRLRDARQINYPNSNQPYSYEADLVITDLRTNSAIEKTISMNNVHETWDGYRFYLASIAPGMEIAAQRAQIIVNHDPAKYRVTYPGAVCVSLGILLLFSKLIYRHRKSRDEK